MLILSILIVTSNKSLVKFLFAAIIFGFFFVYSNADFEKQKGGFAYILGTNLTHKKRLLLHFEFNRLYIYNRYKRRQEFHSLPPFYLFPSFESKSKNESQRKN